MSLLHSITRAASKLETLLAEEITTGSGPVVALTGDITWDHSHDAIWWEIEEVATGNRNWVSMDYPEKAAPGETLVVAGDKEEALGFAD